MGGARTPPTSIRSGWEGRTFSVDVRSLLLNVGLCSRVVAKHVYVFGAGASFAAGAPVMSNFLDRSEHLFATRSDEDIDKDAFASVFRALGWLTRSLAKGNLDLDNLEAVYGAFEMCALLGKPDLEGVDIAELPDTLAKVIVQTLQASVAHPWNNTKPPREQSKPGDYNYIQRRIEKHAKENETVALVTFNYDLCLEHTLFAAGLKPDYGFLRPDAKAIPLLKLHGSMNWLRVEPEVSVSKDLAVLLPGLVAVPFQSLLRLNERPLRDQSDSYFIDVFYSAHRFGLSGEVVPLIVPPTFSKGSRYEAIQPVWRRAADELADAEHLTFVGYSLPSSDPFFASLFAIGTTSDTRIKSIVTIDKDQSGAVEHRYRQTLGPLAERRFSYIAKTFGEGFQASDGAELTFW